MGCEVHIFDAAKSSPRHFPISFVIVSLERPFLKTCQDYEESQNAPLAPPLKLS